MTREEHELLILIIARTNQKLGVLTEVLKSRGIVTEDDLKAFRYAAWDDNHQIVNAIVKARSDYLKIAKQTGVEVSPEI